MCLVATPTPRNAARCSQHGRSTLGCQHHRLRWCRCRGWRPMWCAFECACHGLSTPTATTPRSRARALAFSRPPNQVPQRPPNRSLTPQPDVQVLTGGATVVSGSQCVLICICTAKLTVKGPVHNAIARPPRSRAPTALMVGSAGSGAGSNEGSGEGRCGNVVGVLAPCL